MNLTYKLLLSLVHYDEELGIFTSKVRYRRGDVGTVLSKPTQCRDGFRSRTLVPGVGRFLTHRLVWFYKTGAWPSNQIDHIDRNPLNNLFSNLRDVDNSINQHNTGLRRDNTLGVKGVCYKPQYKKPYQSGIAVNKVVYRERFYTLEEAIAYRKRLEDLLL